MEASGPRSVKIADDERTGWSSERPRRPGEPERPPRPIDVSVRGRVLSPTDRMRYSPGSLVVVVAAEPGATDAFLGRVLEDTSVLLSLAKVRKLLSGKVAEEELEEKAHALLAAAVAKRLQGGESVAVPMETLDPTARHPFVVLAAQSRRPRHLILLETGKDKVAEEDRPILNTLRSNLDAGELGDEGFMTALRLGGQSIAELKRVVFAPAPVTD